MTEIAQITCPFCGATAEEEMPANACVFFYACRSCDKTLRPKSGDCCVFCSYGNSECPPQIGARMNYVRIRGGECATPRDVLVRSIESGAGLILVEADAMPPLFFDLGSGAAGDLVQGIVNHAIRMAVVVVDLTRRSDAFQAFVKEANRGRALRFFESDADAEEWLREDDRH